MKKILMCFSLLAIMQGSIGMEGGKYRWPNADEFAEMTTECQRYYAKLVDIGSGESIYVARYARYENLYSICSSWGLECILLNFIDLENLIIRSQSCTAIAQRRLLQAELRTQGVSLPPFPTEAALQLRGELGRGGVQLPLYQAKEAGLDPLDKPVVAAKAPVGGEEPMRIPPQLPQPQVVPQVVAAPQPAAAEEQALQLEAAENSMQPLQPAVAGDPEVEKIPARQLSSDDALFLYLSKKGGNINISAENLAKFYHAGVLGTVVTSLINVARSQTQTSSLIYCISNWLFNYQLAECIPDEMFEGVKDDAISRQYIETARLNDDRQALLDECGGEAKQIINGSKIDFNHANAQDVYESFIALIHKDDFTKAAYPYFNENFVKHVVAECRTETKSPLRDVLPQVLTTFIAAYKISVEFAKLSDIHNDHQSAYFALLLRKLGDFLIKQRAEMQVQLLLPDNVVKNIYQLFLYWK